MYDLHLTPEQLEFRDTVRDFVENEIKPVALHPDRLQPFEKPLLAELVEKAAQMGLRTLALSEEAGGAGADRLGLLLARQLRRAAGQPGAARRGERSARGDRPPRARVLG